MEISRIRGTNRLVLTAVLVERGVLRYSPAGVAFLDCLLEHESEQSEAGQTRQVKVELAALGADRIALRLSQVALGQALSVAGFITHRSQRGKTIVYHITEFELLEKE